MYKRTGVRQFVLAVMVIGAVFPSTAWTVPNVVFILIDTCREDAVDGVREGVPLMPYLSAFPGMRFKNAFSTSSWTRPSMASMLTSTHVDTHQVHSGTEIFPQGLETMAEYLGEAGYATIGVQSNGQVTAEWGLTQGFEEYVYSPDAPADWITDRALELTQSRTSPFFLYAHYSDPHAPYMAPQAYRSQMGYPDPALSFFERTIVEDFIPYQVDYLEFYLGLQPGLEYTQLSPLGRESARTLYDAEVRFTDDQIQSLLSALLSDNPDTIVIITADHGEHFWEHNSLGHSTTLYEQLVHVPLLINAPGMSSALNQTVVSTVDILPTLSGLLGLPKRSQWEGHDILGASTTDLAVFACAKTPAPWLRDLEMVRVGNSKLIREYKTGREELYDLASDPAEEYNVALEQAATVRQLRDILHVSLLNNARANGADDVIHATPGGFVEEGAVVRLTGLQGTGHVWFKDGVPLGDEDPGITGQNGPVLVIDPVLQGDAGSYECICSDALLHLQVTSPHVLRVLSEEEVPAGGTGVFVLLSIAIACAAVWALRFTPSGSQCR